MSFITDITTSLQTGGILDVVNGITKALSGIQNIFGKGDRDAARAYQAQANADMTLQNREQAAQTTSVETSRNWIILGLVASSAAVAIYGLHK